MFIHTKQPLITSFYIKKGTYLCQISDESALIRNFLRNRRVRRKPIGRVRVKGPFNMASEYFNTLVRFRYCQKLGQSQCYPNHDFFPTYVQILRKWTERLELTISATAQSQGETTFKLSLSYLQPSSYNFHQNFSDSPFNVLVSS